jgi:hypothetical protein
MPHMAPMAIAHAEESARRAVTAGSAISYEVTRGLLAEIDRLRAVDAAAREFADSVGIDIGHDGWARYRRLRKALGLPDR